jgi:hypothetical protein
MNMSMPTTIKKGCGTASEEAALMSRIGDRLALGLGLVSKEYNGDHKLCIGKDDNLQMKLEVRKTKFHLQIAIYDERIIDRTVDLLKKDNVHFVDHGAFLHVITPWQPGKFKGLACPKIRVAIQNFGPVKIMVGTTDAMTTKGEPVVVFPVMFNNFTHVASVLACPELGWVDEVRIAPGYSNALMSKAVCESLTFPFNNFIMRQLESLNHDYGSADAVNLTNQFKQSVERKQSLLRKSENKIPDWRMTDPGFHNICEFRYIVHSLSNGSWAKEFESKEMKLKYLSGYSDDPLQQPESFAKLPYISCTVIDQNHPTTWSSAGLILDVPVKNIRSAFAGDSHTFVRSNGSWDYDSNLPDASEILGRTDRNMWNEVVVSGVRDLTGTTIKIIGGFVSKSPKDGSIMFPVMASRVAEFCEKRGLPVVTIIESENRMMPVPGGMVD